MIVYAPAQIISAPAQLITAPAQPPATGAVVYTALFLDDPLPTEHVSHTPRPRNGEADGNGYGGDGSHGVLHRLRP